MKKILIVDDQRIEREGIKQLLKQLGTELEILEAPNGKAACEILKTQEVDLLLTDIKMPFMSGIELVKFARAQSKELQIAIFSGYGEFSYAQEAIKYGVSDYILKPVKPQEFLQTIARMLENCRRQVVEREEKQSRDVFFYKYLLGKYISSGKKQFLEELRSLGTAKEGRAAELIQNLMLLSTEKNFFEDHGIELAEQLQQELNRKIEYLDLGVNQMLLVFYRSASDNYERIAAAVTEKIRERYGVDCWIAVSRKLQRVEEAPAACQEIEILTEQKFYDTDRRIFSLRTENEQTAAKEQGIDYQKKMEEDIRRKDFTGLWENFKNLQNKIREESLDSQMYVKFLFSELVQKLFKEMQGQDSMQMKEVIEEIYQAGNFTAVCEITERCIQEFEKSCSQHKDGSRGDVEQVKQYITCHVDEDLGIDRLAARVYLSQGYLSYIFKKETGMNLSRYIRQCRMERAKELLKETNMKIVQICEKVGFSNVSYFCQSFREYCGVSPERYRKGEETDEEQA